jgi:hypothetical protein
MDNDDTIYVREKKLHRLLYLFFNPRKVFTKTVVVCLIIIGSDTMPKMVYMPKSLHRKYEKFQREVPCHYNFQQKSL